MQTRNRSLYVKNDGLLVCFKLVVRLISSLNDCSEDVSVRLWSRFYGLTTRTAL
jgi:hypothetical protein